MNTVTLSADNKQYGNTRGHYVARLIGRDSKFTFSREFLGSDVHVDAPGVYEICNIDKKGRKDKTYRLVAISPAGQLLILKAQADQIVEDGQNARDGIDMAMAITKRIDAGEKFDGIVVVEEAADHTHENPSYGYRLLSKGEAVKAVKSATIESATAACWEHLKIMDEKTSKKVLANLKALISPKPVENTEGLTADSAELGMSN